MASWNARGSKPGVNEYENRENKTDGYDDRCMGLSTSFLEDEESLGIETE